MKKPTVSQEVYKKLAEIGEWVPSGQIVAKQLPCYNVCMRKDTDVTGMRFGKLSAVKYVEHRMYGGQKQSYWLFMCDCGKEKVLRKTDVSGKGKVRSCGCLMREKAIARYANGGGNHYKTHGMARRGRRMARLYHTWALMKSRSSNPNLSKWKDYGGRGIKLSTSWEKFSNFSRDMKESYDAHSCEHGEANTTIERINVNGGYSKENCRWATWQEQSNNKRTSRFLSYRGKTMTVAQWSKELGINRAKISGRINELGWSAEKALSTLKDGRSLRYKKL